MCDPSEINCHLRQSKFVVIFQKRVRKFNKEKVLRFLLTNTLFALETQIAPYFIRESGQEACLQKERRNVIVCADRSIVSCSVRFDSVTLWTVAHPSPLSMEFSRQEY